MHRSTDIVDTGKALTDECSFVGGLKSLSIDLVSVAPSSGCDPKEEA